jgi:hypothetical protein
LEKNKSQFKLPSLGSKGSGFSLPKLGSSTSSNLAEFANSQLQNYTQSSTELKKFAIPKLFPSKMTTEESPKSTLVDLKSALVPLSEQMKSLKLAKKDEKKIVEDFIPKFVDVVVDPKSKEIVFDENCCPFTKEELESQFKVLTFKRFSSIGRIMKRRFRKQKPQIQHRFKHKHQIQRFQFDTPSPDDIILSHLNKTRK